MNFIIAIILYAVSTFAFCYGFTTFSLSFLSKPLNKYRLKYSFIFFFIDFTLFMLYGILELGIMINWLFFIVISFIGTFFIIKANLYSAYFLSLQTSLLGLSLNLLQRSIISLILNIPLSQVNNLDYNFSAISVVITFFLMFCIFMYNSKDKQIKPLRHILQTPRHLKSLLLTMSILMIYLLLQDLLYISEKNNIAIKLLSLLSCIYMSFGFLWSLKYTVRFSYLYYLDDQNINLRRILHNFKDEEQHLKEVSDYDPLTQMLNRRAGDKAIQKLVENNINFCLSIIDLDGLKYVNDNLGHKYGDLYLTTIANLLKESCRYDKDILFRYGGDEFVIVFVEMPENAANARLQSVFDKLIKLNNKSEFVMSISFGVSPASNLPLSDRFEQADNLMYKMKDEHKKSNPNFIRA